MDLKTAQGERVVLIEAQGEASAANNSPSAGPIDSYDARHIPSAIEMPAARARELAAQYLRDPAAEIVVYGRDEHSSEVDEVAWQLAALGFNNLYVYRGGKRDWFGAGGWSESTHRPPEASDFERDARAFNSASAAE